MIRLVLLVILILVASACSPSSTPDITSDMNAFLLQNGLPNSGLKCSLLGNGVTAGPDGYCLLSLTDADAAAMVSKLGLQPKTDSLITWQPSGPDCWTRLDFHDSSLSQWYISPSDDPYLGMSGGKQLRYFRLFYLQDKSAACISVSYAG